MNDAYVQGVLVARVITFVLLGGLGVTWFLVFVVGGYYDIWQQWKKDQKWRKKRTLS